MTNGEMLIMALRDELDDPETRRARDAWNAHEYHFKPETYQYTIFDFMEC